MDLQTIKSEKEYEDLLDWVDKRFNLNTPPDSNEGQDLQAALLFIKQYEDAHYPIPSPQK